MEIRLKEKRGAEEKGKENKEGEAPGVDRQVPAH